MPDRAFRFAVERLLSINEACARIFGSDDNPGWACGVVGGDSRDDELAPYYDDDGDYWDFGDVPVDFYVDICASLRRDFENIPELCR